MNTQLHRTLKTTPYEVVFRIKPFSEPVQSLVVIKEHEDQASDTSEISEYDMSDSSCSSDQTAEKHKMKQEFKETSKHTAGNYTTIILLFCYL